MFSSPHERIAQALESPRPQQELTEVAKALRDSGMTQKEVESLFVEFFIKHRDDVDETRSSAIEEVLDLIIGHCGPGARIFP